jgi:hypothetical protein
VETDLDAMVRAATFGFLREQAAYRGEPVFPRKLLEAGIEVAGRRIPLMGPQGIFKPAACRLPISVTTVPRSRDALDRTTTASRTTESSIGTAEPTPCILTTSGFVKRCGEACRSFISLAIGRGCTTLNGRYT